MFAAFFRAFWAPALMGSVLVAVLAAARPLTRRIFGANWHYYIWLAVLAVLVLPVQVALPAGKAVFDDGQVQMVQQTGAQPAPVTVYPPSAPQPAPSPQPVLPIQTPAVWLAGNWQMLLGGLWLSGALVCLAWQFVRYLLFLHTVRKTTRLIACPQIAYYTRRHVRVRQAQDACSPYLVGVFYPTLVLPGTALDDGQLDYILRHETTHLRRFDLLYRWAAVFVRCLHWCNPAVWYAARQVSIECEISCDMAVVRDMDSTQVRGYADTILQLLYSGRKKPQALSTGMATGKKILERRFLTMKQKRSIGKWVSALSAALAVLLAAVTVLAGGVLAGLSADQYTITVTNHGRALELSHKPYIQDGTVYLPLRELLEQVGVFSHPDSDVNWDNGHISLCVAYYGSQAEVDNYNAQNTTPVDEISFTAYYTLAIGSPVLQLGLNGTGQVWEFSRPPVLRGSTTYVPYDYVAILLGEISQWNVQYRVYDRAGTELAHGQYDGGGQDDTVAAFYGAFSQREFDVMKQYCTDRCIADFFGDGFVFGMTQAALLDYHIDPLEYAKSSNDMIVSVTVEMVPHERSVYAPGQTQVSFYMVLLRQPDGRYLIDEFATGI